MTPIFYHPAQEVSYDFISVQKIPEFVRQSGRSPNPYIRPYANSDFYVAHDPAYVDGVFEGKIKNGFGNHDVYVNEALRYTSASMETAAHSALAFDGVACSATQGFHHAHYAGGGGYCTFNGLVVAAIKILPQVGRVMIFDGDAHHGDGTDDCIERTSRQGQIANVSRQHFGRKIQRSWDSRLWYTFAVDLIREFSPGIIFYQAGADAWEEDPYMSGYLTKEGMAHRDRGIFQACKELAIPVVWNLAGGYSDPMQKTIDIHLQTLRISDEVYYGD